MPIGGRVRQLELGAPPAQALDDLRVALEQIGNCDDVDASAGTIRGSIKYGLQKVLVKARVAGDGQHALITFKAQGDDIWGIGAKKVLERWIEASEARG